MAGIIAESFVLGATWRIDVACRASNGGPALDIQSHTKCLRLWRRDAVSLDLSGDAADANFVEVDSGDWANGALRIKVLPDDQDQLEAGVTYNASIWTEAADGTVYDQAVGTIEVLQGGLDLA